MECKKKCYINGWEKLNKENPSYINSISLIKWLIQKYYKEIRGELKAKRKQMKEHRNQTNHHEKYWQSKEKGEFSISKKRIIERIALIRKW